jgi:hypothetical protein
LARLCHLASLTIAEFPLRPLELGAVAPTGYARQLSLVNQNHGWRLGAAWMVKKLVYRLDVTAFSSVELDFGIRRKFLQLRN